MPIGTDPSDVFPIHALIDAHLPKEQRVEFLVRAISCAEVKKVNTLLQEAAKPGGGSLADSIDKLLAAFKVGVVGWNNCKYEFTDEGILQAFEPDDLAAFVRLYPSLVMVSAQEKKVSRSRLTSDAEPSAKPA